MALQVAQVVGHHGDVGAPVFQPDEHAHADGVDAGLAHAVGGVDAPVELGLHAARVVEVVALAVVGLLEADDAVQPVLHQLGVLLGLEGHDFNLQVGEVFLGQVEGAGEVGYAGLSGVLARHQEEVLEGGEALDGPVFLLHLFGREDGAGHGVADVEAAVDTRVGAGVGEVERDEHRHGAPEPLAGVLAAQPGHLLQIGRGGGGDESHEVVHRTAFAGEGAAHVGVGHGVYSVRGLLPRDGLDFFVEHGSLNCEF